MSKKVINGMTVLSMMGIIGLIYWGYQCHLFQDVNSLKHFVLSTGYLAPIFFILIQIIIHIFFAPFFLFVLTHLIC